MNIEFPNATYPELKVDGVYRHVHGNRYRVTALALQNDHEELTPVVVHEGLHDGRTWVRSAENFTGRHPSGKARFVRREETD